MNKILKISFLALCFMLLIGTTCFAGSFETYTGASDTPGTATSKQWAFQPVTGTRYVFRVNGQDIGSTGNGRQHYYINHVRKTNALNHHNPTASEEKQGGNNVRNHELVYVGTSASNTVVFKGTKSNYHFFDTPASSRSSYTTTANGENQYRHIIVWKRPSDCKDKVYTNNFGLNGSDIKKLVEALKKRATALNDATTLELISQIESGYVDYEIRAEILMVLRLPKNSGSGTVNLKDTYCQYASSRRMYMTYREAQAVQIKIDNYAPAAVYKRFGEETAIQLRESASEYKTEYDELAKMYAQKLGKELRGNYAKGNKNNYFCGWDYINITNDNPYEKAEAIVEFKVVGESSPRYTTNVAVTGIGYNTSVNRNDYLINTTLQESGYVYRGYIREDEEGTYPTTGYALADSGDLKYNGSVLTFYYENVDAAIINYQVIGESSPRFITSVVVTGDGYDTEVNRSDYPIDSELEKEGYIYEGYIRIDKTYGKYPENEEYCEYDYSHLKEDGTVLTFYYRPEAITKIYSTCKMMSVDENGNEISIIIRDRELEETLREADSKIWSKEGYPEVTGYIYNNKVQLDDEPENTSNNPIVTVNNDGNIHEIVYWYRLPLTTDVIIYHNIKDSNNDVFTIDSVNTTLEDGESGEYSVGNWPSLVYTGMEIILPEEKKMQYNSETKSIIIECDGNDYEVIFWYKQQVKVNVIAAIEQPDGMVKQLVTKNIKNANGELLLDLPYEATHKPLTQSDDSKLKYYTYLKEYEVISGEGTFITKKGNGTAYPDPNLAGHKLKLEISDETASGYTIVFWYENNIKYDVKFVYVDPLTGNKDYNKLAGYNENGKACTPETEVSLTSKKLTNYINHKVTIQANGGTEIDETPGTMNPFTAYTYKFTPKEETNYVVTFYYTSPTVLVKHQYADGELISSNEVIVPTNPDPEKLSGNYSLLDVTLNNSSMGKVSPVHVNFKDGDVQQELVFIYGEPDIIFDPEDETDEEKKEIADEYNLGVVPSDTNNQLVGQNDDLKYWVLDEEGELTIRYIEENPDPTIFAPTYVTKIRFPFDVYINGTHYNSEKIYQTTNTYAPKEQVEGNPTMRVYELIISNIFVPVFANEGEYVETATSDNRIEVSITQTNNITGEEKEKEGHASVIVVGRIYDFSITNIEGDDKWKNSLFTATKTTHKADTLPLGQDNNYQPERYVTGILKGANIYFSLNTKGSDNSSIRITPRFYHVSQDGSVTQEVDLYSKGKNLASTTITLSRGEYRETAEYNSEILKAKSMYTSVNYEEKTNIGSAAKLLLDAQSRTPYEGYLENDAEYLAIKDKIPSDVSEEDILKEVSHWYGNYAIPNDAVACVKGTTTEVTNGKDGFIVVYFNIVSQKGNSDYLAYNLPSPTRTNGDTEWDIEREGAIDEDTYILPRVSAKQTTKKEVTPWLWSWLISGAEIPEKGTAATIIYEADKSTSQGYTTIGTH